MSAQGLNASVLNSNTAYRFTPVSDFGIPTGPYATQFASDHTKRIKEAAMYREYAGAAVTTGSTTAYNNPFIVPVNYSIVQSNQNRKTYQFGAMTCSSCTGGFPVVPVGVLQPDS